MNNKLLSIILIIFSLLIILGIVYFIFISNFKSDIGIITNNQNNQGQLNDTLDINQGELNILGEQKIVKEITQIKKENVKPASTEEIQSNELIKIASAFAERWGSYSNHSDFNNLNDLKIFMTDDMSTWVDTLIKDGRDTLGDTTIYQGVTTKTISAEMKSFSEADKKAVVIVKTQKTSKRGDSDQTTTSHEDVTITFVKEANNWMVGRVD